MYLLHATEEWKQFLHVKKYATKVGMRSCGLVDFEIFRNTHLMSICKSVNKFVVKPVDNRYE